MTAWLLKKFLNCQAVPSQRGARRERWVGQVYDGVLWSLACWFGPHVTYHYYYFSTGNIHHQHKQQSSQTNTSRFSSDQLPLQQYTLDSYNCQGCLLSLLCVRATEELLVSAESPPAGILEQPGDPSAWMFLLQQKEVTTRWLHYTHH